MLLIWSLDILVHRVTSKTYIRPSDQWMLALYVWGKKELRVVESQASFNLKRVNRLLNILHLFPSLPMM